MKTPRQLLELAFQLLSAGRLKEARRACRKAIQARPDLPEAHLLLSEIHHQDRDATKARESATRALRLRPGWSEVYVALGNAEALAGNAAAAEAQFRSAIAAGSPGAGVHANLGHVLMRQGRLHEARQAYELALARAPGAPELELNVAMILGELGDKAQALERLLGVAGRIPDSPHAQFALGNALSDLGRNEEAISHYGRALVLDAALFNQARALFAIGHHEDAIAALRELLKRDPNAAEPREQLLRVLHAGSRFVEMERVACDGTAIHPTAVAYRHQLGVALWWQGRYDEAIAAFDTVERVAKDRAASAYREAKLDQATALLTLGRLREGWEAYRWRQTRLAWRARFPEIPDPPAELALGKAARVLIIGEQGLGDELFFLRFATGLRDAGYRVYGRFDRKLLGVLAGMPDLFDRVVSMDDPDTSVADAVVLSGDLPLATGRDAAPPLALAVDPARRSTFEARLREFGPPPYIGVTWQAGALPDERAVPGAFYLSKEIPPGSLGAALRALRATVVILQRRPLAEDQERFVTNLGRRALDLSTVNDDLQDALAVLSLLDEYVGVSNTNTHLRAGCPGKRARVLVPTNPEWRWGLHIARSDWFPEFSVYRQSAGDGWSPALEVLTSDLTKAIAAPPHPVG